MAPIKNWAVNQNQGHCDGGFEETGIRRNVPRAGHIVYVVRLEGWPFRQVLVTAERTPGKVKRLQFKRISRNDGTSEK